MAKITIPKNIKDTATDASKVIRDSSSTDDAVKGAIADLREVIKFIDDEIDGGKTASNLSTQLKTSAETAIQTGEDRLKAATSFKAKVTQAHYDVKLNITDPNRDFDDIVEEFRARLKEYVEREDATADFTVNFKEGKKLYANRTKGRFGNYNIKVGLPVGVSVDAVFAAAAPSIVAIYDEMDSDFDEDVEGFLMDI